MNKPRLLALMLLSGIALRGAAQNIGTTPTFMSADVATLGKYGSYGIGYYTGTPDITVPLHDIREKDLTISLALSYDAAGFIPNKNAGVVGLNWQLLAGGAITRQVRGAMDDLDNPNPDPNQQLMHNNIGFIYGQQHGLGTYNKELVRQLYYVNNYQGTGYTSYSVAYDYEPDVFNFNFLGHSGKFFMGNDGQVRVTGDRAYKVDLSGLKGQYDFSTLYGGIMSAGLGDIQNESISQITLTADDGYRFYFGGVLNALEISFGCGTDGVANPKSGCINAWYLTKVVSPEGREILFNYRDYTEDDLLVVQHLFDPNINYWSRQPDGFLEPKFYWNQIITGIKRGANEIVNNTGQQLNMSLIKTAYLTGIQASNETVELHYTQKDQTVRFYNPGMSVTGGKYLSDLLKNHFSMRLDQIKINSGDYNRQIDFNYVYHGRRMFLNQVTIDDKNYGFTYKDTANLPDPLTRGVDLWGFYNGKNSNTDLVMPPGSASTDYEANPNTPGANRAPDTSYVGYGLLEQIIYPTGGATRFQFEANTYSKLLQRKVNSGIPPVWVSQNGIGGGVRIRQITNTPGSTTYYKYVKDYDQNPGGTTSSGLLSVSGIYYLDYTSSTEFVRQVSGDNIEAAASYNEPPLTYSEVSQINSPGFTQFKYSTHETNPDTYDLGTDSYKITPEYSLTNFNGQMKRLFKYSSREAERGRLLQQTVFNSQGQRVKMSQYTYNTNASRDTASVYGIHFAFGFRNWANYNVGLFHSYALYYYQNEPTKLLETTYNSTGQNALTQTTTYTYRSNSRQQVTQMSTTDSKGQILLHQYKYPEDFISQEPYTSMVLIKNELSPIVLEEVYKNSTGQFLSSTKTNYSFFNNQHLIKPSSTETKLLTFPVRTRQLFNQYDQSGNLLESQTPGGSKEVYLWGYENSYPVAQIQGSDYSKVTSVVSPAYIDSITQTVGVLRLDTISVARKLQTYLLRLRTDSRTSGALITTYSYEPLNGLGAKGNPDGEQAFYEYDNSGRLQKIIDNEGKILKAYDYHFKQ